MSKPPNKPLMRSLGEFVGHVVKGLTTDPAREKKVLRREVEQSREGDVVLRRTTIEEIEVRKGETAKRRNGETPD